MPAAQKALPEHPDGQDEVVVEQIHDGGYMQALDIVKSTAEPAFATDGKGNILAWNQAAERLLGYKARRVTGKRCYDILRGTDSFGNRFCDANCPLINMARRREAIHDFHLNVRTANSSIVRANVSAVFVPAQAPSGFTIVQTLKLREPERDSQQLHTPAPVRPNPSTPLTRREIEVLGLLADGRSTREIGGLLHISVDTVRSHVKHILHKLKARNRIEAVVLARRMQLL